MEPAAESVSAEAELRALSRKIRNVSRQCKRRAPQAGLRDLSGELEQLGTRRCATDSLMSMLIYILAGHSSCAAAVFVCGRGWRRSLPPPKQQDDLAAEVEWAFLGMPTFVLVDLEMDPLELVCSCQPGTLWSTGWQRGSRYRMWNMELLLLVRRWSNMPWRRCLLQRRWKCRTMFDPCCREQRGRNASIWPISVPGGMPSMVRCKWKMPWMLLSAVRRSVLQGQVLCNLGAGFVSFLNLTMQMFVS